MTPKTLTLFALAASMLVANSATAAVIAAYGFNSDTLTSSPTAANVTAGAITNGPNLNNSLGFTNTGSGSTADPSGTFTGGVTRTLSFNNTDYQEDELDAFNDGQYVSFTVSAATGYTLDLNTLTFGHSRSSSAPRRLSVYVKTAAEVGFTERLDVANNGTLTINSDDYFTLDLAAIGTTFDSVTSVEFRLVFHDDNSSPGNGYLDNIVLQGEVIPEPGSMMLIGAGLALIASGRRAVV